MSFEEQKELPIGLVDLDGVLCDYDKAMQHDLDIMLAPGEKRYLIGLHKRHPSYVVVRMDLIKSSGEWWENLPQFKLGFDVLEILKELNFYVSILTQGPKENAIAWSHKLRWCIKNVPYLDITITRRKGLVYGKVLVDDYPVYIQQWLEHRPRGLVIMPAHEWNKDFVHPNVIRYDGANIKEVRKALVIVRNRKSGEELKI